MLRSGWHTAIYPHLQSQTLHKYLASLHISWPHLQSLLRKRRIKINTYYGSYYPISHTHPIHYMDYLEIQTTLLPQTKPMVLPPVQKAVPILQQMLLAENKKVLVLNKMNNFTTQGDKRHNENLYSLISSARPSARIGIVHRVDKAASGTWMVGKTLQASAQLNSIISDRDNLTKIYVTMVWGSPSKKEGIIQSMILQTHSKKVILDEQGRLAQTWYKVVEEYQGLSLLIVQIREGRKHQIRVQMAKELGTPIVNDCKYGAPRILNDNSILLHSLAYQFKDYGLFEGCRVNEKHGRLTVKQGRVTLWSEVPSFWNLSDQRRIKIETQAIRLLE